MRGWGRRAYGPAAREEFARWWGMQPAPAGRILNASADELTEVDVNGYRGFVPSEDLSELRKYRRRMPVRLLPMFDAYVVGTRPRESLMDLSFEKRVFRAQGWISPVVLVNGMISGVWSQERKRGRIEVTVEPFRALSAANKKAISEEADRLGAFLDAPIEVSFTRR